MDDSQAVDVPIGRLRPLRDRSVTQREYDRIVASIKAIGLIEPLLVFPEGDEYVILDGTQRYKALVKLGVDLVPCIIGARREAFTANRMVNRVSPVQEYRMIEKSLEELDERTIAATLGLAGLAHRIRKTLLKQLHPDVVAAVDQGKITRTCMMEFTHVTPERQKDIIAAMAGYNDYSLPFARTLIVKTPPTQRAPHKHRKHDPWDRMSQRKNDLLKKLQEAEQKHDFYSRLYKQYTIDLLRLAIYARSLLTNTRVREYLDHHYAALVSRFDAIIADARG